jgi:hypothetical protein
LIEDVVQVQAIFERFLSIREATVEQHDGLGNIIADVSLCNIAPYVNQEGFPW